MWCKLAKAERRHAIAEHTCGSRIRVRQLRSGSHVAYTTVDLHFRRAQAGCNNKRGTWGFLRKVGILFTLLSRFMVLSSLCAPRLTLVRVRTYRLSPSTSCTNAADATGTARPCLVATKTGCYARRVSSMQGRRHGHRLAQQHRVT